MLREGMKCVIYLRVSTEMQVDGFSLDGQRTTLKRYVEREGMTLVDIYEDAGKSGKSIEGRPSFQRMLNDIKNDLSIDYILVYKLSRFGRNAADILNSIQFIQDYGVNLIATEEGIDSSQTSGKLLISVLSAVSEIERENIIEQTMNGRKEKARQGGWNGGFAPYGYKLINGKLEIEPKEAVTVKKIFQIFADTNKGLGGVANEINLTDPKIKRHNGTLDTWRISTIKGILDNPVYNGKIAFGRRKKEKVKGTRNTYHMIKTDDYILEKGTHEAIIDDELWERVRQKRKRTGIANIPITDTPRAHLLSGILKCPVCGKSMHICKSRVSRDKKDGYYSYYACRNSRYALGTKCTYRKTIREDILDSYVNILIMELAKSEDFLKMLNDALRTKVDSTNLNIEKANLEQLLIDTRGNVKRLEEEIDTMPINISNRDKRIKNLNTRLYQLYDRCDLIEEKLDLINKQMITLSDEELTFNNIISLLGNYNAFYEVLDSEERKKLIRYLFRSIEIYHDFTRNKIIKSFEMVFRVHKDQERIMEIVNNPDTSIEELLELEYETSIPIKYDLEGTELGERILDSVNQRYANEVKQNSKPRGPYHKNKTKYCVVKERIKEEYGINIWNSDISKVKKLYGIANGVGKYTRLTALPSDKKIEILHKVLVEEGIIPADAERISEEDIAYDGSIRPRKYIRKQPTYKEIKEYVLEKYELKVSTANIAQIKREYGINMQANRIKEDSIHPGITPEKRKALTDALYHFRLIENI